MNPVEPILTKQEITELLAAVKSGRISTNLVDNNRPGPATPAEHLDLFKIYERSQGNGEKRIPNLDIILDNFARRFSTRLTNVMLRKFTVERTDTAIVTFRQSLDDLNNQGAVAIYSTLPLKYGCLFHFDTMMAFTLLEIMLGSAQSNESLALNRHLTTIETSLLKTVMLDICNELAVSIRPIIDMQVRLTKVESNFRLVNIVEPDTEVLVTRFNILLSGESCGQMRFIIPYPILEPLREKFKEMVAVVQEGTTWTDQLAHETREIESLVIACSGQISMTIRKILSLRPGDIIDLRYNPDQPLTILVEDQPLFHAIAGERNGKKAFHVTGRYSNRLGGIHGST